MGLKDLTQDLQNFQWTNYDNVGGNLSNKSGRHGGTLPGGQPPHPEEHSLLDDGVGGIGNPQSFDDGKGNIVSGKKSFDRPSKSALEGMESIFGPKYSNVGTRGSYTNVDFMDGTKQGRGFIPPGGPPLGFTVDMGKSEYAIGDPLNYTLTPLSHTISQMNSDLWYGVVPEQTLNAIPIAPGAWGSDFMTTPLASYFVIHLMSPDTLTYNVDMITLTGPTNLETSYQTELNTIPKVESAHGSDFLVTPLEGYQSHFSPKPDSVVDSVYDRSLAYISDITEPNEPIFKQFTRGSVGLNRFNLISPNFPQSGFTFTEEIPYVIPQTNFTGPTTSPFVPDLFDNTPKLEHAHSIDPISRLISYPGLYVGSQGDINETAPQPLYSTPDYGVFTGPVGAFNHTEVRSRLYDVYQHHFQPTDVNFVNIPLGDNLFGENEAWRGGSIHIGSQDIVGAVGGGVSYYGNLNSIIPRGSIYNTQIYSSTSVGGQYRFPQSGHTTIPPGVTTQYPSNIPTFDRMQITLFDIYNPQNPSSPFSILSQPAGYYYDSPQIPNAHGSDFMVTPILNSLGQWYDTAIDTVNSQTHTVDMITLTGPTTIAYQTGFDIDSITGNLVEYTPGAHGSNFTVTSYNVGDVDTNDVNAWSSIFANQSQFLKYTVHEHGFPDLIMETINAAGEQVPGTPLTRDDAMYTTGTIAKSIHGGPIFGDSTNNIFKQFTESENSIKRIELDSPNWDPDGNNYWTPPGNLPHTGLKLQDDSNRTLFGTDQPFIVRDIGERWGTDHGSTDAGFMRGGIVAAADRTATDVIRIGAFQVTTPQGIAFMAKQAALQMLNPRPETRLWNPLSIVGSLAPTMHMQRHWSGFGGGLGQSRYGSFHNPLGEEAFYKNTEDLGALFGLIDEKQMDWGYGYPEEGGFGNLLSTGLDFFYNERNYSFNKQRQGNRLTSLASQFLQGDGVQLPVPFNWKSLMSYIPSAADLGRTPAIPTQYVFSQNGPFGKAKVYMHGEKIPLEDWSGPETLYSEYNLINENPGVPGSVSYWVGKGGTPHWDWFDAHGSSDELNYKSSPYHNLDSRFSYMNAFRKFKIKFESLSTSFSKRGGHRNAALTTNFYSPLIQYSWRFFNPVSDNDDKYTGGEEGWHENTQKVGKVKEGTDYTAKSFTSDPKSATKESTLIKEYSLMSYGDITGGSFAIQIGNKLESRISEGIEGASLLKLNSDMLLAEAKAKEAINKIPESDPNEGLKGGDQDLEAGLIYSNLVVASKKANAIFEEAALLYKNATDNVDRLTGLAMVELATTTNTKAADAAGDPYNRGAKITVDGALGKIKKLNSSYNAIGHVDQVNMIPYGEDYGDTEDFIKFKFKDIVNNKFIVFRAILSGISDTVTPEWEATRFIGRPDDVHVYKGASRKISFSFDIYPKTKQEFPVLLEKLNFLIGLNYPSFNNNRMVAPFIELTLGDMFKDTPGYIDGVTVTPGDNSTWEMQEGLQFPKHISCQCDFTYIGKYMPSSLGKHYELPWLKDQGWKNNVDGETASAGTFVLGKTGLTTDEKSTPAKFEMQEFWGKVQPNSLIE